MKRNIAALVIGLCFSFATAITFYSTVEFRHTSTLTEGRIVQPRTVAIIPA